MKVGFISLGCSKNLIDTEMCIGLFKKNNFSIVNNPNEADILVVNTCGFIESAKEEAINTILEMAEYKKTGKCKYLIAMGCLVKRYKDELIKALPEVDFFISIDEYDDIWKKISELIDENRETNYCLDYDDRVITTGNMSAYLKIAEGCSNNCTYCAIPMIRGKFVSRKMEDILNEARGLAKKGIKEIIVIAQDTTKYGIDLYGEYKLAELLNKICEIDGIEWIRFLYAYPESITDELIDTVKSQDKICNYFDIPIQHFSDRVLKRMNRKSTSSQIDELLFKIRSKIPDAIIRTSLIVGFPDETEEDFEKLFNFVKKAKFEHLGTFEYSKEDGTPAAKLKNQIHYRTKQSRYKKIMELQQKIAIENLLEKKNKKFKVLIESVTADDKFYVGRSYMEAPDTDGFILVKKEKDTDLIDKFIGVKIIDVNGYDLIGIQEEE